MRARWTTTVFVAWLMIANIRHTEEPLNLKILYAGDPKSGRTADFQSFLKGHFAEVGIADYLSLRESDTKGYDVIILDWPDLPPRDENGFKRPQLGRNYSRPTILVGGGVLAVTRDQQLKLSDLCICLGDAAHGIVSSHEIFHKPYEVHLSFEDRPTPSYYRSWPEGERLGETMKVWKVQTRGWSVDKPEDSSILPGMVADPYGFTDSPNAEVIASGINMKSPAAVAIGRHGNFLLWGFFGPPSLLNPEARRCFVNAVCYISKFDGQPPLVRKPAGGHGREWALVYAFAFMRMSDSATPLKTQPDSTTQESQKAAELHRKQLDALRNSFPEDLRVRLGTDPARYVAYYRANLEFLRPAEGKGFPFTVDEEVKGLGLSNRRIELLDRCVEMLERRNQADLDPKQA